MIKDKIRDALKRKKQVLLYGASGTGKTSLALDVACQNASQSIFGLTFEQLSYSQQTSIFRDSQRGQVRLISFHPGMDYLSFVEGYRPEAQYGQEFHILRDGLFKKLCKEAQVKPEQAFYLVIDNLHYGNIPRIFGELLSVLEPDSREKRLVLSISGESFYIPQNLSILATLSGHPHQLEPSFCRRFAMIEVKPDLTAFQKIDLQGLNLARWIKKLNANIRHIFCLKGRFLQLGQGYFIEEKEPISSPEQWLTTLQENIIPYIESICEFEETKMIAILGEAIMDWYRNEQDLFPEDLINRVKSEI